MKLSVCNWSCSCAAWTTQSKTEQGSVMCCPSRSRGSVTWNTNITPQIERNRPTVEARTESPHLDDGLRHGEITPVRHRVHGVLNGHVSLPVPEHLCRLASSEGCALVTIVQYDWKWMW